MARPFSAEEDRQIEAMLGARERWSAIGAALGRDPSSIFCRARALGLSKPPPEPEWEPPPIVLTARRCLCCRAEFQSAGPANRLCDDCRRLPDEPVLAIAGDGRRQVRRYG